MLLLLQEKCYKTEKIKNKINGYVAIPIYSLKVKYMTIPNIP
ncbi:hypothetical protein A0R60_4095 [Enterobacter asburiae]|nr:hypothetical protein A0R60_2828 [Enterobacter asburiae]AMX08319.1 hypothetical protein A0R60_4095 [Enterobacter asburiae]